MPRCPRSERVKPSLRICSGSFDRERTLAQTTVATAEVPVRAISPLRLLSAHPVSRTYFEVLRGVSVRTGATPDPCNHVFSLLVVRFKLTRTPKG
jgi:hypothetical protein